MTLYTYLIERLEKYRSLNPIEFQELELEMTSKLIYYIGDIAIIEEYPFRIEFNDNSLPNGIKITMYNSHYQFTFIVNMHESNIALVRRFNDRGEYYHKLNPLINWVCRIFNFEYRNDCFTPKSFQ